MAGTLFSGEISGSRLDIKGSWSDLPQAARVIGCTSHLLFLGRGHPDLHICHLELLEDFASDSGKEGAYTQPTFQIKKLSQALGSSY